MPRWCTATTSNSTSRSAVFTPSAYLALLLTNAPNGSGSIDALLAIDDAQLTVLRSLELIAGVRPLTQFDAAAVPMLSSFTDTPHPRPYDALTPQQSLDEKNPHGAPMAAVSARQDLRQEDRIDEQTFNQAIWKSVKGVHSRMPNPVHRLHATAPTGRDTDG